jgi:large subunit ribosomal protein L15
MAGLHKHKWSYTVKYAPDHFGSNIWHPPNQVTTDRWINLFQLGNLEPTEGVIDLVALGYDKLLGEGIVHGALKVKARRASESAIEKIKAAGGSIEVIEVKVVKEKPAKPEAKGKDSGKKPAKK